MNKKVLLIMPILLLLISGSIKAQIDTTQMTFHPKPIVDAISYVCNSGNVAVLIHIDDVEGYTFGVSSVEPSTVPVPPSNDTGVFELTGSTAASFTITSPQGCILDTLVEFDCNDPLPIDLLQFNAVLYEKNKGLLTWQVNEKSLVRSYEVFESFDAVNFNSIAEVPSTHSDGIADYQLIDEVLKKGSNFYKLKINYNDGTYEYSPVRVIYYNENSNIDFMLFPNPTSGIVYATLDAAFEDKLEISITDNLGRQVMPSEYYTINQGYNKVQIDLSRLANATYLFRYNMPNNKLSGLVKIVKKN